MGEYKKKILIMRWVILKSLQELSDEKLIESFEMAKQKELSNDFIRLLECEMKIRGILQLVS
ncbi:hypothetical protein KR50_00820 [Jeotgalibacillus campisalis]|uniref:Sporulation histidine kinase inhibitor Sda n=1 Tax=Jeotgalibacillus campisalis TaxID=220754 RepID=A0A0C2W9M7_9BACL|nr:hypothetical protein KR50_00820 [Jeotgalibacillus campisalis]